METLDHLFWYCYHSQHFWNEFANFMNSLNVNTQLNLKIISFGITDTLRNKNAINYTLLCAKYFIFVNKCLNTIPKFQCFKSYLKSQIDVEKAIAHSNDKLEVHENKWNWLNIP